MLLDIINRVNEKGLEYHAVLSKAREMGAFSSAGIDTSKLDEILDAVVDQYCASGIEVEAPVAEETIAEEKPEVRKGGAEDTIRIASELDQPLTPGDWNLFRVSYMRKNSLELPTSKELTNGYGTWEGFWQQTALAGELEPYEKEDVIRISLDHLQGHDVGKFLARRHFDDNFPEYPSSGRVEELFDSWTKYSDELEKARDALPRRSSKLPAPSIDDTLQKAAEKQSDPVERMIKYRYGSIDRIATKPIKWFKLYDGKQKQQRREEMVQDVMYKLDNGAPFKYLGLEGVNFTSYIQLQQYLSGDIDASKSLIVEKDSDAADTMKDIVSHHRMIDGGEIFEGLSVARGFLHEVICDHPYRRFDILNLDFMGGWCKSNQKAVERLFLHRQVADNALMYITLLDTPLERKRVKDGSNHGHIPREGFGTDDQLNLVSDKLIELCGQNNYSIDQIRYARYKDTQDMIFMGFYLESKGEGR